jgi:hypothetical protein
MLRFVLVFVLVLCAHADIRKKVGRQRVALRRGDEECNDGGNAKREGEKCDFAGKPGKCIGGACTHDDSIKHPCSKTAVDLGGQVLASNIEATLAIIGKSERHHTKNAVHKADALKHIVDQFTAFHLADVKKIKVKVSGVDGEHAYGILQGSVAQRYWIVVAHYDSVSTSPGAIDNGSGVSSMLEVIRILGAWKHSGKTFKDSIIFVASDFEEICCPPEGVKELLDKNLLGIQDTEIKGMISVDSFGAFYTAKDTQNVGPVKEIQNALGGMTLGTLENDIGADRIGDFLLAVTNSDSAELHDTVKAAAKCTSALKFYELPFAQIGAATAGAVTNDKICNGCDATPFEAACEPFCRSDHANFWNHKIPAIQLTDTGEFRSPLIGDAPDPAFVWYHKPLDKLSELKAENYNFMADSTKAVVAALVGLADHTA